MDGLGVPLYMVVDLGEDECALFQGACPASPASLHPALAPLT